MYYVIETDYTVKPTVYRTSSLTDEFRFKPSRWITGKSLGQPKEPIKIEFWQKGGNGLAEILEDSIPLFSKDLVEALQRVGVDNLQIFPITTVERKGRSINEEYFAVNIIGCIQFADLDKSEYTDITGTGMFAINFRKLVIDKNKTQDLLMFRLAESVSSIIIHERVKLELDKSNFKYLIFRKVSD